MKPNWLEVITSSKSALMSESIISCKYFFVVIPNIFNSLTIFCPHLKGEAVHVGVAHPVDVGHLLGRLDTVPTGHNINTNTAFIIESVSIRPRMTGVFHIRVIDDKSRFVTFSLLN